MTRVSCICLGILFYFTGDIYAQEWVNAYTASKDAFESNNLEEAKAYATTALQLFVAEHGQDHRNVAVINRQLALIHFELSDLERALYYGLEEVNTLTRLGENSDFNFGNAVYNVALVRNARSEYKAAEALFEQAAAIYSDYIEQNDPEFLLLKGNWGISKFHQGKDAEAEAFLSEAFTMFPTAADLPSDYYNIAYNYSALLQENGRLVESLAPLEVVLSYYRGTTLPGYGNALNRMGDTYQLLGNFVLAEEYLIAAREFFEQNGLTERQEYLITLNLLATNFQQTGKYEIAENLLLTLSDNQASDTTISKEITFVNLGSLLFFKGKYEGASLWYGKVIDLYTVPGKAPDENLARAMLGVSKIAMKTNEVGRAVTSLSEIDSVLQLLPAYSKEFEVSLIRQKASVLQASGKISEARLLLEEVASEALELWGTSSIQYGSIAGNLGMLYQELADYSRADAYFNQARAAIQKIYGPLHPEYAILLSNYASLKQLQGFFTEAESLLLESLNIKEAHFGTANREYLISFENLATLYFQTGRYQEAEAVFEKALDGNLSLYGPSHPFYAFSLRNLGKLKRAMGDYTSAEKLLAEASQTLNEALGNSHVLYISSLNDLALLYVSLGNLAAAKPLFEKTKTGYELNFGKEHPDYATALENISTVLQLEGKDEEALPLLEEALLVDEKVLGKNHPLYSKTLHNLASLYQKKGDLAKAEALYVESLEIYEQTMGKDNSSYASSLYNLAVLFQEKEDFSAAETLLEEVRDIRQSLLGENHPDFAYTLYGLASVNQRQNDRPAALDYYEKALEIYDFQIKKVFPALSEEEKSSFYSKIRPVYEAFQDFGVEFIVLAQGNDEQQKVVLELLYDVQLSTKALLLNASNKVRSRILASNSLELIGLFNQWIATKEKLAKAYSYSIEELEKNGIDIRELETTSNTFEKQLSERSNAFAGEFDKEEVTWSNVKSKLNENEAAVEIVRIKKNIKNDSVVYAGLILYGNSEKHIKLVFFPNGYEMEGKSFRLYKNSIIYKLQDERSFETYWEPYAAELKDEATVYISSDGIYNKVNLNTLYDPTSLRYVVETKNIHLLSNTRELIEKTAQAPPQPTASLFGFPDYEFNLTANDTSAMLASSNAFEGSDALRDFENGINPLPGTLVEVKSISDILAANEWKYETLLEKNATEEHFKKIGNTSLIHIATHGFFLEDFSLSNNLAAGGIQSRYAKFNPLFRSGLLLAGSAKTMQNQPLNRPEDGVLTAYEVMNLNLDQTELIVMSACETGLGEVKNGEGVYGLQRAFIVAGAKSVVMSLWKVNDETTQRLMTSFYTNWFGGMEKYSAFRKAVLDIKGEFSEPFYWGAFVMLGE